MSVEKVEDRIVLDVDPYDFDQYLFFLQGKKFRMSKDTETLFDFMGHYNKMEYPTYYWAIKLRDNWIRDNMYKFELYKDPYYGLVEVPIK